MLSESQIRGLISEMWTLHLTDMTTLDRIYDYVRGRRGIPTVPEDSADEVKELASLSVKNVLGMIRDSFAQNLSVVGFRAGGATENAPGWALWQRNRMDARQHEVHRPTVTYGVSYLVVMPDSKGPVFRPRSPRQLLALYADPQLDQWPQYALETWIDQTDAKPRRKGLFYDDTSMYPVDLGPIPVGQYDPDRMLLVGGVTVATDDVVEHGALADGSPVCPVVRFVNDRDADDLIVGEIGPLIIDQQAINSVNFDRLIVSRFGAFPQKVISGWSGTKQEVIEASARRVWTFEDDVKAWTLDAASIDGYNNLLEEMMSAVAMKAQISPAQVIGKMVNVSADALAAAEANQQRKLASKRDSLGESWEQALRLGSQMSGDTVSAQDMSTEVVWRDTEARSFASVVDGLTKLATVGVPIGPLLTMIPGMTQQQVIGIKQALASQQVGSLVDQLRAAAQAATAQKPIVNELAALRDADAA